MKILAGLITSVVLATLPLSTFAQGVCFLYQHWDLKGRELALKDGDRIAGFHRINPPFNDQASSAKIVVPNGKTRCILRTYQDAGYQGCRREYNSDGSGKYTRFSKANPSLGIVHIGHLGAKCEKDTAPVSKWKKENDNASSATCHCN